MRPVTLPPPDVLFGVTFLPEDFSERLEYFKEASDLPWDAIAACMGVDPRQLRRWRHGTRPSRRRGIICRQPAWVCPRWCCMMRLSPIQPRMTARAAEVMAQTTIHACCTRWWP